MRYFCFLSVETGTLQQLSLFSLYLPYSYTCIREKGGVHATESLYRAESLSLRCITQSCLLARNELFSFFCSTSVHGSILHCQQFIYHPHRLEPHFCPERPPEGVRVNWERATHLQWLWHWAVFTKDIWQKSVSISNTFLSVKDSWAKLIVLCAKFKKNSLWPSQANSTGAYYRRTEVHISRCLKQKILGAKLPLKHFTRLGETALAHCEGRGFPNPGAALQFHPSGLHSGKCMEIFSFRKDWSLNFSLSRTKSVALGISHVLKFSFSFRNFQSLK